MSNLNDAHRSLDEGLPEGLQRTTRLLEPSAAVVIETPADAQSTANTETIPMTGTTPATANLSTEQLAQIKSVASEQAATAIAQQNNQVAIASTIEHHLLAAGEAKAVAANAVAELATANKVIADLKKDLETEKVESAKFAPFKKKAEDDKEELDKKYKKAKADLEETEKKLLAIATTSKITERKAALAAANIKAETKFAAKAIATDETTGALKMNDDDFNDGVADLKQPAPAAATTPEAAAAAATAAAAAAAQATASQAAPREPDLSAASAHSLAVAALAAGAPLPTETGRAKFAGMFGASNSQ